VKDKVLFSGQDGSDKPQGSVLSSNYRVCDGGFEPKGNKGKEVSQAPECPLSVGMPSTEAGKYTPLV
jgi:hypothetical protein